MRILIFLHGTLIMHMTGVRKTRKQRVKQSMKREPSVLDYENYVPIGNAVRKLMRWKAQGASIIYLSSHEKQADVRKDKNVLKRHGFPKGRVLFRKNGISYKEIAESTEPDVLIEDNCESIGGKKEMIITHVSRKAKKPNQ